MGTLHHLNTQITPYNHIVTTLLLRRREQPSEIMLSIALTMVITRTSRDVGTLHHLGTWGAPAGARNYCNDDDDDNENQPEPW